MSELNIQNWLSKLSETVKSNDFENHIDLISENIATYGMPNGKTLNFFDWQLKRKNELQSGLLKNLSYDKLVIKNLGLRRLKFSIEETLDGKNGEHVVINKEVLLEHEQDAKWRMVEETIIDWNYFKAKKIN